MRIIKNELYKLFHTKMFVLILAAALGLNLYIAMSTNAESFNGENRIQKSIYAQTAGMTLDDAYGYTSTLLSETEEEYFASADFDEELWVKRHTLNKAVSEIKTLLNYDEYLDNIELEAQRMTSVSIFADKNSFSYRNISKTPAAYKRVRGTVPVFAPSAGVLLATDNVFSDLLAMFVILAAVTAIFYQDRENGLTALIKPLKYGRAKLALSKIITILVVALLCEILFYGTDVAVGAMRFGLGDLRRPVQSLSGYIGCNLTISVFSFMTLTYVVKLFSYFLVSLILDSMFTRLKNATAYVAITATAGIETALYLLIDANSAFSLLKRINLVSFVCSSRLFVTYSNVNLFGLPVNLLWAVGISLVALILAGVYAVCKLYSNISVSEIKRNAGSGRVRMLPKCAYSYAQYKAYVTNKGLLILVAVLAFQIYSCGNIVRRYNLDDSFYSYYCALIASYDTQTEADEFVELERQRLDELMTSAVTQEDINELQGRRGFDLAKAQYEHLKTIFTDGSAPTKMFYQSCYNEMFGVNGFKKDYSLALVAILSLCFAVSPLIAYDNRCKMGYLLYATKAGKKTYLEHNIFVSVTIAVLTSLFVYIPYFLQMLKLYGYDGISETIRCIEAYKGMLDIPIWGYIILLLLYRMAVLSILSGIVLWISSKCQSTTAAAIISMAAFALPVVVYLAGADFIETILIPLSGNREVLRII